MLMSTKDDDSVCNESKIAPKHMVSIEFLIYWTLGLPEGVLSNRPCPCVCPSLNISETVH